MQKGEKLRLKDRIGWVAEFHIHSRKNLIINSSLIKLSVAHSWTWIHEWSPRSLQVSFLISVVIQTLAIQTFQVRASQVLKLCQAKLLSNTIF